MRIIFPVLAALGLGAIALGAFASGDVAYAQHERTVSITSVGDFGVSGSATIAEVDGGVEVSVLATGLSASATYLSGVYDSSSVTCSGGLLGSFSDSFSYLDDGVTYTLSRISLDDVFSVSIRDSSATGGAPPGAVVGCGEGFSTAQDTATPTPTPTPSPTPTLTPTGGATPTPGAFPTTGGSPDGDSGSLAVIVALIVGAIAVISGGAAAFAARRR